MLLAAPVTILTAAVTILAALICQWTAIRVGRVRRRHKIDSPAMTGARELELALRVQGNTVEQIVLFLPLLWVAALYFPHPRLAGAGHRGAVVRGTRSICHQLYGGPGKTPSRLRPQRAVIAGAGDPGPHRRRAGLDGA